VKVLAAKNAMKKLGEARDYLRNWLDNHKRATEIAPAVQEAFEEINWQIETLNQRPQESVAISTSQVDEQADITYERITRILPQMPRYDLSIGIQVNSIAATAGTVSFNYILQIGDMGMPSTFDYASNAIRSYRILQDSHSRPDRVRELLTQKFPTVVERFDLARRTYRQHELGIGGVTSAALEMRTVLDAVKGELFASARKFSKENMTWEEMSNRLSSNTASRETLLKQGIIRSALYDELSQVAKQRGVRSIESLWTQTLDHLFVVLAEIR
jgi:hypothetical protein